MTYYRPQPLGFSDGCCCTTWPDSWSDSLCFNTHCCYGNHQSLNSLKTSLSCRNPPVSCVERKSDVQQPVRLRRAGQFCDGPQTGELRRSWWLLFRIFFYWFKKTGLSFACAVILCIIFIQVSLPLPSTARWTPRCLSPQQTTPRSARAGANRWGTRMTTCCSSPSSRVCWTPAQRVTRSELLIPPCLSAWSLASLLFADWPAVCPWCQMFCWFALVSLGLSLFPEVSLLCVFRWPSGRLLPTAVQCSRAHCTRKTLSWRGEPTSVLHLCNFYLNSFLCHF